jgi:3'(2'), 5'-bisphosphate nucleotidase
MMKDPLHSYLISAMEAALNAGNAIMKVYQKPGLQMALKADRSPVTEADQAAHRIISGHLSGTGHPILSEEGREIAYEDRKTWKRFWLVDPLDGTKEFIRGHGEFTVNIALVEGTRPSLGILYAPFLDVLYYSTPSGAYRIEGFSGRWRDSNERESIHDLAQSLPCSGKDTVYRVVASRSHLDRETNRYIRKLKKSHPGLKLVSGGSALKFCLVAEGSADIYPRFGPTWEWDTGAGQAIAEAAGCRVTLTDGESSLSYNKANLLNPGFIVRRGN